MFNYRRNFFDIVASDMYSNGHLTTNSSEEQVHPMDIINNMKIGNERHMIDAFNDTQGEDLNNEEKMKSKNINEDNRALTKIANSNFDDHQGQVIFRDEDDIKKGRDWSMISKEAFLSKSDNK